MNNLFGGWSSYSTDLSDSFLSVFKVATKGLIGVSYVPFAVSTQIVAGTNYHFLCNATIMNEEKSEYAVMVRITDLVNTEPAITEIHKI